MRLNARIWPRRKPRLFMGLSRLLEIVKAPSLEAAAANRKGSERPKGLKG